MTTVEITLPEPEEIDAERVAYWGSWQRNDFLSAGPDGKVDLSFAPTSRRVSADDALDIAAQMIAAAHYAKSFENNENETTEPARTAAAEDAPMTALISDVNLAKLVKATREIEPFSDWLPGAAAVHEGPAAGDLVMIHVHKKWRPAVVLRATARRVRLAYLTPNRLNRTDHYTQAPLTTWRPPDEVASARPILDDLERIRKAAGNV